MIVREIRLENVKSYGSPPEVVRLMRGVNAISGTNGSGKSTILEAIGCALFQHSPYRQEDFVREGETSGTITVVVESRFDQRTYEVVRRLGRGAVHYVYDPDIKQQVARGEADIGAWLKRHLQVDPDVDLKSLFQDSVGPPQGTLTAAFLDAASERKGKFDRLLRVEEYLKAWNQLRALDTAIDAERRELEARVASLEGQTRSLPDVEARRSELRDRTAAAALELSRCLAERDVLDRLLAEFGQASARCVAAQSAEERAAQAERHAAERTALARADYDAAVVAKRTVEANQAARDLYLAAETDLRALEVRRRERDGLQRQRNERAAALDRQRHEHDRLRDEVTRGEEAIARIAELERRIPAQDAAARRLADAQLAKRTVDQARQGVVAAEGQLARTHARVRRAEAAVVAAERHQAVAATLDERRTMLGVETEKLARANRAAGALPNLQQAQADNQRQAASLRRKISTLDREIADAARRDDPTLVVATLEQLHHETTSSRGAAVVQLEHATSTRAQVAGGLCPFLHEECRNLREGVTLETYFDGEIKRWTVELDRLNADFALVSQRLQLAREVETAMERARLRSAERDEALADLADLEERIANNERKLRLANDLANSRSDAEREQKTAALAVLEAERATDEINRLPTLRQEVADAADEQTRVERQLALLREQVTSADAVTAELQAAEAAANEVGHPREEVSHLQTVTRGLPDARAKLRAAAAAVAQLATALAAIDGELLPYTDVDVQIETCGFERDRHRPGYEAWLAAQAISRELPTRQAALAEAEEKLADASREHAERRAEAEAARQQYDTAAHASAQVKRSDVDQAIHRIQAELDVAAKEEQRLNGELARLRGLVAELEERRRSIDAIDEERAVAGALRGAIRAAGPEITRQLLARISRIASRINAEVLSQAGVELEWTPEYEIVTRRQGETRGFAQLSGGEQMAAALAVRLAAMRVLSNLRVAFLDEPTAHLDQARRTNLGDQVQRLQGFDQLVVISHDDTFDGLFGHVVRISSEGGRSRVVEAV